MLASLLTIAAVHIIALMSPGPDCFIVMQTAVARSRKEAICCVLGITLGVAFWAALSLIGLQWLFERFAGLQQIIMFLGGAYLLWLSYLLIKSSFKKGRQSESEVQTSPSCMKAFMVGLLTNLSNAKALIYFSSVFSLFVTGNMTQLEGILIYLLVVCESFLWFAFVALILGMPKPKQFYRRSSRRIDGICGGIFGIFGIALIRTAWKEANF